MSADTRQPASMLPATSTTLRRLSARQDLYVVLCYRDLSHVNLHPTRHTMSQCKRCVSFATACGKTVRGVCEPVTLFRIFTRDPPTNLCDLACAFAKLWRYLPPVQASAIEFQLRTLSTRASFYVHCTSHLIKSRSRAVLCGSCQPTTHHDSQERFHGSPILQMACCVCLAV